MYDKGCNGAPDIIIDVLSPSTASRGMVLKLKKIAIKRFGIVNPDGKAVMVYTLENGKYFVNVFREEDTIVVTVLKGGKIKLNEVFSI